MLEITLEQKVKWMKLMLELQVGDRHASSAYTLLLKEFDDLLEGIEEEKKSEAYQRDNPQWKRSSTKLIEREMRMVNASSDEPATKDSVRKLKQKFEGSVGDDY